MRRIAGPLAALVRRARSPMGALTEVTGLGLFVAAAWRVDEALGLAVAGASCLVVGVVLGARRS